MNYADPGGMCWWCASELRHRDRSDPHGAMMMQAPVDDRVVIVHAKCWKAMRTLSPGDGRFGLADISATSHAGKVYGTANASLWIDGQPAELDDIAKIHEDALVAWDRDGMSSLMPATWAGGDYPPARIWTESTQEARFDLYIHKATAYASFGRSSAPRAVFKIMCGFDSPGWVML